MNVEARSQTIESVLKKGKYIIPEYQREYDWTDVNLSEFLDDLNTSEEENYFIGHMVCEGDYNGDKFKVIDGQQRITTITIMLSVLRDVFIEKKLENLAVGLHDNYIFAKDRDNNEFVVLDNKMPYPVLQSYVQCKPEDKNRKIKAIKSGEKKIIKAYDKFYKLWKNFSEEQLKILRDKILNLEIIFVAVEDEVDAFTIFETLNAKGKDLTPLDLIKNQVFKNYERQPHIEEPNDSWKEIIENSKEKSIKFLNYFWSSRYKKVSDRKLYKEFMKESTKGTFNYNVFIKNLLEDSQIFKKITLPQQDDWNEDGEFQIYFALVAMQTFNIQVANSSLLSLLRGYQEGLISATYLIKALRGIEKFHFINNAIVGARSSGLDIMYSRISRDLYNANDKQEKHIVIDKMIDKLKKKLPDKELFMANIDKRLFYSSSETKQKKVVQYVLRRLEYERQNWNVDLLEMSIEHIYPEKPIVEWEPLEKMYIKNIGNLVLIDRDINAEVGNKVYNDKKRIILEKSTILSTKSVFENNEVWDIDTIKARKNELIDNLYNF